jgi:hypothetical protein
MAERPTLKRPPKDEGVDEAPAQTQARAKEQRFLLRVDSQIKRSFSDKEGAVTAGAVIKKAYPVVMVTVLDSQTGGVEVIK